MDANEVGHKLDQLRGLKYGEKIIYHVGFLANDRGEEKNNPISQIAQIGLGFVRTWADSPDPAKMLQESWKERRYNLL